MEIWKDIPGFNGDYEASDLGRIRRRAREIHCQRDGGPHVFKIKAKVFELRNLSTKGYPKIKLRANVETVHSLVALTFLGPRPLGHQVNHKDGNKLNNALENLEYVTNQQNRNHAVAMGLHPCRANGNFKISFEQIEEMKKFSRSGMSQRAIAEIFQIAQQTVSKLMRV